MANKPITIENWNQGGLSDSPYAGADNSLAEMVGVDVHDEVGLLKANRVLEKISGSVIDGLVKVSVGASDGGVYFFSSDSGKIWRWDGTTMTLVYTTSAPQGDSKCLGAIEYDGFLWWAVQNYIYRISLTNISSVSNWATFWTANAELYSHINWELAFGKDPHYNPNGGVGEIYTLPTTLSEDDTDKMAYQPMDVNLIGVAIDIVTKGTGNITITIHDEDNNSLGSKTVALSGLATGLNEIYFASTIDYPSLYSSYHVHITVDTTGTTLNCFTDEDLATAYIELFVECDDEFHSMKVQNNTLYIGDRNYVHEIKYVDDDSNVGLTLSALDIPRIFRVKSLGIFDTDLAIGTAIDEKVQSAITFRWNTWSPSWSIEDEVPENSINAFLLVDNAYYIQAGDHGALYYYSGEKLYLERTIYGDYAGKSMTVHPNAVSSLKGIPLFGVSNLSGNPVKQGVYSFGTRNSSVYPRILNLEYVISTGNTQGIEIGCMIVYDNELYVTWKDGSSYGIDKLSSERFNGAYVISRYNYNQGELTDNLRKVFVNYVSLPDAEAVVADPDTDIFTLVGHNYNDGDNVKLAGILPTGLSSSSSYYVINSDTDTFQLSATLGGSAIDFSTAGTDVTININKYVKVYYRKNYTTEWKEVTLVKDTLRNRYDGEFIGEDYIAFQLKLELLTRGEETPKVSYILFDSE